MKLKIVNRSGWPDWFVGPTLEWVARRAGITGAAANKALTCLAYTVTLANISRRFVWAGTGGRRSSRLRIDCRYVPRVGCFPELIKDWRYKHTKGYEVNNRVELFVHLAAHEFYHATGGHPVNYLVKPTRPGRRTRVDAETMEWNCERFARETVLEFRRAAWEESIKPAARRRLRLIRGRKKAAPDRTLEAKAARVEKLLNTWVRKSRLAATKLRKYQREFSRLAGQIAARKGGR